MKSLRICGLNLYDELYKNEDAKLLEFQEINIKVENNFDIKSTAIRFLITNDNKLEVISSLLNTKKRVLEFKDVIKKVESNNEQCWIISRDGKLFNYDFISSSLTDVSFNDEIQEMSCMNNTLLVITKNNHFVTVKTDGHEVVHEFPKHQKIKKIVCGSEHCILLTSNGDMFSFGCGLRGALGQDDVNSYNTPKQVEGLAGLKIIDVAAGCYHSVAVSSFGDVFVWGWNTDGQLGLPKDAHNTFKKSSESSQQVFSTPKLINLEDENEAIKSVYCGYKHIKNLAVFLKAKGDGNTNCSSVGRGSHNFIVQNNLRTRILLELIKMENLNKNPERNIDKIIEQFKDHWEGEKSDIKADVIDEGIKFLNNLKNSRQIDHISDSIKEKNQWLPAVVAAAYSEPGKSHFNGEAPPPSPASIPSTPKSSTSNEDKGKKFF